MRLTKRSNKTVHENGVCCTHFRGKECSERMGECTDNCPWEEAVWSKLADYEDAEEQGLLLRNPKDLENAILDRMQEFMEEWRCYSESSIDHFGGKVDAMEVAQKIVKGAFKSYLEEAESALAEKGGAE